MKGRSDGSSSPADATSGLAALYDASRSCDRIKYAAYRTAAKVKVFQDGLGLGGVRVSTVDGVLARHRLVYTNEKIFVGDEQLESILYDLFYASRAEQGARFDVERRVSLTKEFLTKVFNSDKISVLDLKVCLVCLCGSPLQAKYQYWFKQLCDHNLLLPRTRLNKLLDSLLALTRFLSESNTFSSKYVESTLDSCYGTSSFGVNASEFICWTLKEPQLLVWLSTLYRMRAAEGVEHGVRCASCGSSVLGLRYSCLKCTGYDLCQECFFTGKVTKKHKLSHKICEYCVRTSSCVMLIRSLLYRLVRNRSKLQYLPADDGPEIPDDSVFERPGDKLTDIISQIEAQRKLLNEHDAEAISDHVKFLEEHAERLRSLRKDIQDDFFMSTPVKKLTAAFDLSPVVEVHDDPSTSRFSDWADEISKDVSYTQQLHRDLDLVMQKLNGLIDSNFSDEETTKV